VSVAALARCLIEHDCPGGGNVEGADAARHGDPEKVVASAANEVVETCTLSAEDKNAISGEVEAVVVGSAAFVEADDPEVPALELFEGADEVDDAGDTQVLSSPGTRFHGNRAERGGTALGENDTVDAGAVGYAEKRAEILRVFDAVKSKKQASRAGLLRRVGREEVFNGERLLWANVSDHALMGGGLRHQGQLLTAFLADADAGLAALRHQLLKPDIVPLLGYEHVVKTAASGFESFFYRMQAVQDFHEG
jgi:hypothetical protein